MDEQPVSFSVEYPDRPLNRLTTAFRIFTVIPIAILLGTIGMTVKIRNAVVRRFSGRSGYSTEKLTGCSSIAGGLLES